MVVFKHIRPFLSPRLQIILVDSYDSYSLFSSNFSPNRMQSVHPDCLLGTLEHKPTKYPESQTPFKVSTPLHRTWVGMPCKFLCALEVMWADGCRRSQVNSLESHVKGMFLTSEIHMVNGFPNSASEIPEIVLNNNRLDSYKRRWYWKFIMCVLCKLFRPFYYTDRWLKDIVYTVVYGLHIP